MRYEYVDEFTKTLKIDFTKYVDIRLDGSNFSKLCKMRFKPIDSKFTDIMISVMHNLMKYSGCDFAYTTSDEITLFFKPVIPPSEPLFGGKVHKILSKLASFTSSEFILLSGLTDNVVFDCRYREVDTKEIQFDVLKNRWNSGLTNSIQRYGWLKMGPKYILNKDRDTLKSNLLDKGFDWTELDARFRYGVLSRYESSWIDIEQVDDHKIKYYLQKQGKTGYERRIIVDDIIKDIELYSLLDI